jgi:predicted lipid-binding transport protein (Tim44 family)
MRNLFVLTIIAAFAFTMLGIVSDADARRFGGGMSFGKQRMKQSAPRMQRQSTPKKSAATGQRGSARTGMMGMIGGLALGGMLGAMFFGGAFEGINLFDILIIGGGLMLLFWFMRRKAQPMMAYANQHGQHSEPQGQADADIFSQGEQVTGGKMLRPDINEKQFLGAARDIYMRMQKAWDSGDVEDIREFCTAEIADRISHDMQTTATNRTEVATLDAEIADSWIESDLEWVAVNYTAMLHEQTLDESGNSIEDETAEVNEIWIFQHAPQSKDPTWYLAGIQQVN